MKSILGFRGHAPEEIIVSATEMAGTESLPVRSLVQVRFPGYSLLTYYNDKYDLHVGDLVYVTGKLEGHIGKVETVSTKFRIRKSDYQKVLHRLDTEIHGEFMTANGFMVSKDTEALAPERFRAWVVPPDSPENKHWDVDAETGLRKGYIETEDDDDLVVGDGYELSLHGLEQEPDVKQAILDRAKDYCSEKRVKYLHTKSGAVKAYVLGSTWYEVEFCRSDDAITGLYCDCPYPALCKHALAALLTIRDTMKAPEFENDFIAMENDWFWGALSNRPQKITL